MEAKPTDSSVLEKRIRLPEPDMSNITVLTRQLPNEPILPWHHYDSPWLDSEVGEEPDAPEAEADRTEDQTEDNSVSAKLDAHEAGESKDGTVLPDNNLSDAASSIDPAQAEFGS